MIRSLDAFLIAQTFQPLVDLTQRQPAWCARQCALLGAVCAVLWPHFTDVSLLSADTTRFAFSMAIDLAWCGYYYFAACHPPRPPVPRTSPRLARGGAS